MVILAFFREEEENRIALLEALVNEFPQITSLMYTINTKGNDTLYDQDIIVFRGRDYIIEEMEGLKFRIGPKSFFQTNTLQSLELYKIVREFAGLTGNELVYDLYTGTGTIANFVAKNAKKVIGIESVPEAIADAWINSEINGISNVAFFSGDIKDLLSKEFMDIHGRPDVVITDPPRAGMHESVVQTILEAAPKRIVYVSCNPATQARDLEMMSSLYKVEKVQPVDMFPHTHHVENVVRVELR
jgi:23S rRNA (uracil1939-C5)-methyltransferase